MPNKTAQLSLPSFTEYPIDLSEAANAVITTKKRKHQLWLCLYFPKISLEIATTLVDEEAAHVIVNKKGTGLLIHAFCHVAHQYGITINMSLNAAYALCPKLTVLHRDEEKEAANIAKIADWAQNYTSQVNIVSTEKILLEIKGSLLLFYGLSSLLKTIESGLSDTWPHDYQLAVSPTPLASQLLCECAKKTVIEDNETLRPVIGHLPMDCLLKDNRKLQSKINKIGVKTIQELWRLPRDSLARRFGAELLKSLDQLIGATADPRMTHQKSLTFSRSIDLPMETSSNKIINHATKYLIEQLSRFLIEHDRGVSQLQIVLKHLRYSTTIVLNLRQLSRSASHVFILFVEKMERIRLRAPVLEVTLVADEILSFVARNQSLLPSVESNKQGNEENATHSDWENTLEQLQNRLGINAVKYLSASDDIHPDFAWCYRLISATKSHSGTSKRPLWLLNTVKPLRLIKNKPCYRGLLSFASEPERIQTGWWKGKNQTISRDYYIVLSPGAGYLWIYRDLKQKGRWYLHGFVG